MGIEPRTSVYQATTVLIKQELQTRTVGSLRHWENVEKLML